MVESRNCYFCKYYKGEYCENLELKPCYPQKGCEDFSRRMTRKEAIDIIKCLAWHTRPDEEDVEQAIKALEQEPRLNWHYTDLPPSDPYKRYLVIYSPWDYNNNRNFNPRFTMADYYLGEAPSYTYKKEPWHFDVCYSAEEREILAWADVGTVKEVLTEKEDT